MDGILYCNDGDWVESCTSLVEDMNGRLSLVEWPKIRALTLALASAAPLSTPGSVSIAKPSVG